MSSTHRGRRSILLKMVKYSGEIAVLSFYVVYLVSFPCILRVWSQEEGWEGEEQRKVKRTWGRQNKIWQRDECSGAVVDGARCWAGLGGTVWHTALCRGKEEAQVLTITDTNSFLKKINTFFLKACLITYRVMQAMSVHEREEEWVWSLTGAEWTALREQGKENMINDTDTI